jgi:hypothetical protein
MADRPSEYIRFIDGGNAPALTSLWTLTDPNATVWGPSISTSGVITMTDGATAATTPIFIGLDGTGWVPSVDNNGIITVTSGSAMASTDTAAVITDSNSITWTLFVDTSGQVNVTSSFVLPALFRYPSTIISWTPTSSTDQLVIYSIRSMMTVRRKTS